MVVQGVEGGEQEVEGQSSKANGGVEMRVEMRVEVAMG